MKYRWCIIYNKAIKNKRFKDKSVQEKFLQDKIFLRKILVLKNYLHQISALKKSYINIYLFEIFFIKVLIKAYVSHG